MEPISTKLIQALAKQADLETRAKDQLCEILKCQVWPLPARMVVPYAFSRGDHVIGFADIIYGDGVVSGIEYSLEKLTKARNLARDSRAPVYIVLATDAGILGVNTQDEPKQTRISLSFRTEDTEEVVPYVYFDIEQFRTIGFVDQAMITEEAA